MTKRPSSAKPVPHVERCRSQVIHASRVGQEGTSVELDGRRRGTKRRTAKYKTCIAASVTRYTSSARLVASTESIGPSHQNDIDVIPMPRVCRGAPSEAPKNTQTCRASGPSISMSRPRPRMRKSKASRGGAVGCSARARAKMPRGHVSRAIRYRSTKRAILARQCTEARTCV